MGIVRRAFDAAVPASVLLAAITVVLAVFFVVLLVIGDEVAEGEAIVARNEIDALFGLALPLTINAGLPSRRSAMRPTESFEPRKKARTSSRN